MNINELKKELKNTFRYNLTCKRHEDKVTPMLWGPPGVGKSDIIYQIAEELGYEVIELRLSSLNPVDVRGFPVEDKESGKGKFLLPYYFPNEGENKKIIIFLDEINTALPSNQVTAYELCQNYSIGGKKLPNEVLIVAAGNREEDGGATFEMPTPLANRFQHFSVLPSVKAFVDYGVKNNLREEIIGFVQFKPGLLHAVSPSGEKAFPTPRSWTKLSNLSSFSEDGSIPPITEGQAASIVGEGAAGELIAFTNVRSKLPDLDEVLRTGKPFVSSDRSIMFSYITGIAYRINKEPDVQKLKSFVSLVTPLPEELQAVAIHMTMESLGEIATEEDLDDEIGYFNLFQKFN